MLWNQSLSKQKMKTKNFISRSFKNPLFCHEYPIYTTLLNNTIEFSVTDLQIKPVQPRLIQLDL